jgi:hypothetical protein
MNNEDENNVLYIPIGCEFSGYKLLRTQPQSLSPPDCPENYI